MATIFSLRPLSLGLPAGSIGRLAARCLAVLLGWDNRLRERQALRALDDRALEDLGLTRADIMREVDKRFWQG